MAHHITRYGFERGYVSFVHEKIEKLSILLKCDRVPSHEILFGALINK